MDVPESLRRAYLATEISVSVDDEVIDARRAFALLGGPYYVVTAWNPGSEQLPQAENAERNEQLHAELVEAAARVLPARGRSPDGTWYEESYAAIGIGQRTIRALGRNYGQAAIFEITADEQRVLGCFSTWVVARPLDVPAWDPPPESDSTFPDAVHRALGVTVASDLKRAGEFGWVHDDGVGLACPTCDATLELFGCELRAKDTTRYRAMLFVCPEERSVRLPSDVPARYRSVARARRAYLTARRDADAYAGPERAYSAYCIELDDGAGDRTGPRPWIYVGQTARTPEERFAEHQAGIRASRWVRHHGVALRPDLYADQPVLRTHAEALTFERWLYESLRAAGWPVKGGH